MSTDRNIGMKIYMDKLARAAGVKPAFTRPNKVSASPTSQTPTASPGQTSGAAVVSKLPAAVRPSAAGHSPERS